MKKIANMLRAKRLILETIESLNLNLSGMSVLTEAGSGAFIVTPLIAVMAGADMVYVVSRDSSYGKRDDILFYLKEVSRVFCIDEERICIIDNPIIIADKVNIVTNLGFVRPITKELINKLPFDSAIPLMWETWEVRNEDIDFVSCKEKGIPILGTNERDKRLCIFRYVGMLALKLLFEQEIEVYKSNILVVSSGHYLYEIEKVLLDNGANVYVYNPFNPPTEINELKQFANKCDALVIAEQQNMGTLVSENEHIRIDWLDCNTVKIVHIAGVLDYQLLERRGFSKHPNKKVDFGYMTVTTDYVGIRPVIDLHSAGLKVGQALVEGMRIYKNPEKAQKYALEKSPAMDFDISIN
jgi:hypothetical protein